MTNPITYANPDNVTKFNILVRNNQDTVISLSCVDGSNTPINLTGAIVKMDVRAICGLTGAIYTSYSTTNGSISLGTDPTLGVMTLTISKAAAAGYTWVHGYFDIQVTQSGISTIVGEGVIDVVQGITST